MTAYKELRTKLVLGLLDKFPSASTRTLSRICYRDNPLFFKDEENARSFFRYYRGANGDRDRKSLKNKKYVRYTEQSV